MDCDVCKENRQLTKPVPYIVYEASMARAERTVKRLWILAIVLVFMLVATNVAWLWYESQFEYETTTTESYSAESGDNGCAIINGDGEVTIDGIS